jgi:hypothetical protein
MVLPCAKLPAALDHWTEVDLYIQAKIAPAGLQERDVNMMHHVITDGPYTYLHGVQVWCHAQHPPLSTQQDFMTPSKQNAIKEVAALMKQVNRNCSN